MNPETRKRWDRFDESMRETEADIIDNIASGAPDTPPDDDDILHIRC